MEYFFQIMEGREGVETNQVQEIKTLSADATVTVMGVAMIKMLVLSFGSMNARCCLRVKTCWFSNCMLVE